MKKQKHNLHTSAPSTISTKIKIAHALWLGVILAAFAAIECRADLNGGDDFNDNSKDTNRWGEDVILNSGGVLTETSQRLEYSTAGSPTQATTVRPWVLNTGSYNEDWDARVDVHVPPFNLTNGQSVFVGLLVYTGSLSTPINYLFLEFGQSDSRKFKRAFAAQGVKFPNLETETAVTNAAVRLAFDSQTKTLSVFFDENGSDCGYVWTLLQTDEVGANWGMSAGSVFNIAIIADSQAISLGSTNSVFFDNFSTASGTMPHLGITSGNGQVVISWATNAPTCHLESTSALTAPACWQVSTNIPGIAGTNFAVTNAISGEKMFYRLSR